MIQFTVNPEEFKFKYIPEFAAFILENSLQEFVTVGIRFARQYNLPLMKPLSRLSEKQLTDLSMESNRAILSALAANNVAPMIKINVDNWINNKIGYIDKTEIAAEDLTLAFFIRRKAFSHFLYSYTPNPVIHQLITEEIDQYTTFEELINLRVYLQMTEA